MSYYISAIHLKFVPQTSQRDLFLVHVGIYLGSV